MRLAGVLPTVLWLSVTTGSIVRPEVIGRLIDRLRDKLIPKDPILPPDELFPLANTRDFNDWSVYRGWMGQYLRYLRWYCLVALSPDVFLDDLLDPPVYIRTWFAPAVDSSTFRFGITFQLYD